MMRSIAEIVAEGFAITNDGVWRRRETRHTHKSSAAAHEN